MTGKESQHISAEAMRGYACGTLGEADRERVDAELLGCEQCLELFMNVVENESNKGPVEEQGFPPTDLPDLAAMEDRIISELARTKSPKPRSDGDVEAKAPAAGPVQSATVRRRSSASRPSFIQRPVVQYTIAASITLLLLASGALAGFTQGLEKLDESHVAMPSQEDIDDAWKNQPSWSDQLVSRTGNWLDGIQASRFK